MPFSALLFLKVKISKLEKLFFCLEELPRGSFDFNIDTGGQAQLIESLDCLGSCLHDINHPLMRSNFVLLTGFFVDVRAGEHGVALNPGRQWNRAMNFGVCTLGSIHNLRSTLIKHGVIVGLHTDANNFLRWTSHGKTPKKKSMQTLKPLGFHMCVQSTGPVPVKHSPLESTKKASEKASFCDFPGGARATGLAAGGKENLRITTPHVNTLQFLGIHPTKAKGKSS